MVDILKTKTLPSALTSYDVLKTLALILMIVDHIGYFFYPENMWWRVVGRMSVPIWFFLIGYANTRDVPKLFWAIGGLVTLSALVAGEYLFPLSIVFTLILARLIVDWMYSHALRNREAFAGMFFFLFLMCFPTLVFTEYGTLGLLFTLLGALRRHKEDIVAPRWMIWTFIFAIAGGYILVQSVLFTTLSPEQLMLFVGGMVATSVLLYRFEPRSYDIKFRPLALVQLTGRRTLELYAAHLIIFRAIAMSTDPERFTLFDFKIFAFEQLQKFFFAV